MFNFINDYFIWFCSYLCWFNFILSNFLLWISESLIYNAVFEGSLIDDFYNYNFILSIFVCRCDAYNKNALFLPFISLNSYFKIVCYYSSTDIHELKSSPYLSSFYI
jgi:hypothetical protein